MRVLFVLLLLSLALDGISLYLLEQKMHNRWILNSYTIVEYFVYCSFFLMVLQTTNIRKFFLIGYIAVGSILFYFTLKDFWTHINDITMGIESIVMIFSSAAYFYIMLRQLKYDSPFSNPFFWLNSAILIYFSGSFFVFIFIDYRVPNMSWDLWNIHSIVRIIFNLLLVIGFWKTRKITT